MWYIYTIKYHSAIKKNEIMPFEETWMQIEIVIPSEVCQTKSSNIWYHLYAKSKKNYTNELICKTDSQT